MKTAEPLPSNRKVPANRNRTVDLTRPEFYKVAKVSADAMLAMANFNPESGKTSKLREDFNPLYGLIKKYAEIAYGHEFDQMLIFGAILEKVDLVNGLISVEFTFSVGKRDIIYHLNFRNHMAPYSIEWPKQVAKNGGRADVALSSFSIV